VLPAHPRVPPAGRNETKKSGTPSAAPRLQLSFSPFWYIDTGRLTTSKLRWSDRWPRCRPVPASWTISTPAKSPGIDAEHILDRACIGHCFSYENYEPPSASFAYEPLPATRLSMSSPPSNRMARATRNSRQDLAKSARRAVFEIARCDGSAANICVRQLSPDEIEDLLEGYQP